MGSLIVAVRQLVVDGIAALPGFTAAGPEGDSAEVSFGYKAGSKQRDRVWTQRARFSHSPASMRPTKTHRDERGSFEVVIRVEGVGMAADEAATRAVQLGEPIEDWFATHSDWQGQVDGLNWMQIEGEGALTEAFSDKGYIAELIYPAAYQARLT